MFFIWRPLYVPDYHDLLWCDYPEVPHINCMQIGKLGVSYSSRADILGLASYVIREAGVMWRRWSLLGIGELRVGGILLQVEKCGFCFVAKTSNHKHFNLAKWTRLRGSGQGLNCDFSQPIGGLVEWWSYLFESLRFWLLGYLKPSLIFFKKTP